MSQRNTSSATLPKQPSLSMDWSTLPLLTAGVDEAGRGPLAGDVFAAAVILDPEHAVSGLNDSKKLSAARREDLAGQIKSKALAWHIASATVEEIDELNILQATFLAMSRAVEGLQLQAETVLIDGNSIPPALLTLQPRASIHAIVKGDSLVPAIAAASILAKTARDAHMLVLDEAFPDYGFGQHKGYPTALHLHTIERCGPSPVHRRSFGPVKRWFAQQGE